MTENGDFLSQTAFFRAIAIETGPLDIKCDSGQDQCTQMIVTARPSNNAPALHCNILPPKTVLMA